MSADGIVYLDSSALVKLVVAEPESESLIAYLGKRGDRVSCALARVEVIRAVRGQGERAIRRAGKLIESLMLLRLDDTLLDDAAALAGDPLRGLDAIHLAAARTLDDDLAAVVTYDGRMAVAAQQLDLPVDAPR